jgi:peptidoglycan hydrolase-like protein with peptidoglycan-binding domain
MLRKIRIGDRGPDVLAIQEGLNRTGRVGFLEPDGKFGNNTDKAVRRFQRLRGLDPDGIVGPITRSHLFPLVATTINMVVFRARRPTDLVRAPRLVPQSRFSLQPLTFPPLQLPVPTPAPAPPVIPAPRLKFDQFQLQPGNQFAFTNVGQDAQGSFAVTMQSIFKRGEDDGRLELALGLQAGSPIFVTGQGGSSLAVSWFANFTWVDPLGALGLFHLWSPFATIGAQTDVIGKQSSFGGGLFPINLGIDLEKDRLSIQVNSGVVGTIDPDARELKWGIQTTFGLSGNFILF